MSSWFRRRFTYHESFFDGCPNDEDPSVLLQGYRTRSDPFSPLAGNSNYENADDMSSLAERMSSSPMDSSVGSEDSSGTVQERDVTPTPGGPVPVYTPVLRRRRSTMNMKRNYRIMAPDESLMILQQHQPAPEKQRSKLLRRKSTKKDNEIIPPPMVITPPVLVTKTQSCMLCSRERSIPPDEMSPPAHTMNKMNEEEAARLSFVSSSTGYSSARSSLRSSDGGEENNTTQNRDSGIGSCSLSSTRRSVLLSRGKLSHLDRIAIELIDTERSYVNDLNDVIQGYLNFLVDKREELRITLDDVSSLFGCIERIFSFNRKLFQQLDSAELDCFKMSKCFVENAGKFEDYIVYCTNYHRMLSTLSHLQMQPLLSSALSERQSSLGHALPLSSYLLKPVQRILKYHLFLENMLKNLPASTPPEHVATVKRAHEVMTTQAGRINDEKKRVEHSERVQQLQTAIQKWKNDQTSNLSTYGDLLLEAPFRQAGSKTVRLLFLFEEMLLIVKQRNSNYVCKDYIMCSNLMLNESICADEPLAFQVLSFDNPKAQYIFLASTTDQKRIWMTELKRMMLDHYGIEIPEKTKQLMLSMDNTQRIAFGRPEFAEVSMKNQKKVPKYLEKRRKSMDQDSRRRSLSATRILSSSKTSLADLSRYKLFGIDDEQPKCTCHLNSAGTSTHSKDGPMPVTRTLSASTIEFGGLSEVRPVKQESEVQSSRSRYHQARNRRHLPPKQEPTTRSCSNRRLDSEEVGATFDELYNELVSYGNEQVKKLSPDVEDPATKRLDALVWRGDTAANPVAPPRALRSKSLTRLDDVIAARSESNIEMRPAERRYSKIDHLKKMKARKYTIDEMTPVRLSCGRLSLTDKTTHISDGAGLPPTPLRTGDEERSGRPLSARQRTALTAEQVAELDTIFPSVGVVKNMIRNLESTNNE